MANIITGRRPTRNQIICSEVSIIIIGFAVTLIIKFSQALNLEYVAELRQTSKCVR